MMRENDDNTTFDPTPTPLLATQIIDPMADSATNQVIDLITDLVTKPIIDPTTESTADPPLCRPHVQLRTRPRRQRRRRHHR